MHQLECGRAELADAELRPLHDALVEHVLEILVSDWPAIATLEHHQVAHEQDPLLECARHVREGWTDEPREYRAELLQRAERANDGRAVAAQGWARGVGPHWESQCKQGQLVRADGCDEMLGRCLRLIRVVAFESTLQQRLLV